MLLSYLKIALRNIAKYKGYSFINIAGLAIGIGCCILILLYVQDELSFDRFHQNSDRIYRIIETRRSPDQGDRIHAQTAGPVGPTLVNDFPEVESAVRFMQLWRVTVEHGENRFYEGNYLLTEPTFFEVFDFKLKRGNPETALSEPQSVVLTEQAVRKYFGDEEAFSKTLQVEGFGEAKVTGILEDIPANSHLHFSMLFPFATPRNQTEWWSDYVSNWDPNYRTFITYISLKQSDLSNQLKTKLLTLLEKYQQENSQHVQAIDIQPLPDIHFYSENFAADRNQHKGDIKYIYIFSAIALFIVLIACINYMNLATARSMQQAKEVGMRKVAGASQTHIAGQTLIVSVVTAFIAFFLALALVQITLPMFNQLSGKELELNFLQNSTLWIGMIGLTLIVGLLAGSYPSIYLSRFNPAHIFRGSITTGKEGAGLRRGLVITQFVLSIIMLVMTLIVHKQLEYIQHKKLGFKQEQMVAIDINSSNVRRNVETMKSEMLRLPDIKSVSVSSRIPVDWKNIPQINVVPQGSPISDVTEAYFIGADGNFLSTYGIEVLKGRNFSKDLQTDSLSVLINETAAKMFGGEEPLGKRLRIPTGTLEGGGVADFDFQPRVSGVLKDFHFQSLHQKIGPLVIGYQKNPIDRIDYFSVRVDGQNMVSTLDHLRNIGERYDPDHPFEYNFLDDRLTNMYQTERRIGKLSA
ncbi:MAG: FtsX-like permease family protein, partial [Phycisphaerae bacterium]|nr:FtsX-like permease family protein [Phycisphaerae bacterium]